MIKNHQALMMSFIFFVLSFILMTQTQYPRIEIDKQDSAFNLNQNLLRLISFGQKRMLADILWVKTLLESDLDHYAKKDLNSWMYLRFKSIADLDPKFYENYLYGGQYLMVVKDDVYGAEIIFKRGTDVFKSDYSLNYNLGFLYAFELGDSNNALKYFLRLKDHPLRTYNFDSFLAKIMNQSIGVEEALHYSIESLKRTPKDTPIYTKIKENIYSLKAKIDLSCLNKNIDTTNCNKVDYFGDKYIYENGKFKANLPITEIRLKIKESN